MASHLRCNQLDCRTELQIIAVVTTCSHIFCRRCAETHITPARRVCPACKTELKTGDDAALTVLTPTEEYKTSVLSGMNPSVIMECVSRGLSFWSYQTTQEIVYQGWLAKGFATKSEKLDREVERVLEESNAEIQRLHNCVRAAEAALSKTEGDNHTLDQNYKMLLRNYNQTKNELHTIRSGGQMEQIKDAAINMADARTRSSNRADDGNFLTESVGSNHTPNSGVQRHLQHTSSHRNSGEQPRIHNTGHLSNSHRPVDHCGIEQVRRNQRSGSANHSNNTLGRPQMPPPRQPLSTDSGGRSSSRMRMVQPMQIASTPAHRISLPMMVQSTPVEQQLGLTTTTTSLYSGLAQSLPQLTFSTQAAAASRPSTARSARTGGLQGNARQGMSSRASDSQQYQQQNEVRTTQEKKTSVFHQPERSSGPNRDYVQRRN